MKNKCYNVIVNIVRESEDIIADAFTCTGWTKCQVSRKMQSCWYYWKICIALDDFNRKKLKTFAGPLKCIPQLSQLSKWDFPCDSLNNPAPTDKTLVTN